MSDLKLIRASPENKIFPKLRAQWEGEIEGLGDEAPPVDSYSPVLDYAEKITNEDPQDKNYGVFLLTRTNDQSGDTSYEGLVHVNFAKFHKSGKCIRLTWNLVSPRFQSTPSQFEVAEIQGAFLTEAFLLAEGFAGCKGIRFYLGNSIDRDFMLNLIAAFPKTGAEPSFKLAGNWLHLTLTGKKLRLV